MDLNSVIPSLVTSYLIFQLKYTFPTLKLISLHKGDISEVTTFSDITLDSHITFDVYNIFILNAELNYRARKEEK